MNFEIYFMLFLISILLFFSSYLYYGIIALFYIINAKKISKEPINRNSNEKCLIVIPILNGQDKINERIDNIIQFCNSEDYEINLISDGSTDKTLEIAKIIRENKKKEGWQIYVDNNLKNIGRALTHNKSIEKYHHKYFLFSDLDTQFTHSFPSKAYEYIISNEACLAVSGRVVFKSRSKYGEFLGKLFFIDVFIRKLSDISNLCMKGSGPALIVNKKCWIDLKSYEDIDHCVGFMAIKKGGYLKYKYNSLVFDLANSTSKKDLNARRRMTRKSLLSFFNQLKILKFKRANDYFSVIGYALHKPFRFVYLPSLTFLWIINIYSNIGIISILLLFPFFLVPQLKVVKTIILSYLLGIYDFLRGRKSGIYTPVNSK